MIKHYNIADNRLVEVNLDKEPGLVLVAIAPDNSEQLLIQEQFYLDDFDLASSLDTEEIPRIDITDNRRFMIWKVPLNATAHETIELGVSVVGLALAEDRLALITPKSDLSFTDREFRRIGDVRDVMLAFLLRTVHHFVSHLRIIRQISAELENKITVSMENRHLLQMFALGESLVYYADAIEGNGAVLTKLRSVASQYGFQAKQMEILDDIILENSQAARQANIYSSVLSGLMDARGTIVNNNMSVSLKNLTLINLVFLPLNLIAGIGGMSEWTMMTKGLDWKFAYLLFCAAMVVIGFGTWFLMKKFVDRVPKRFSIGEDKSAKGRLPGS